MAALVCGLLVAGEARARSSSEPRRQQAVNAHLQGDARGVLRALEQHPGRTAGAALLRARALRRLGRPLAALQALAPVRPGSPLAVWILRERAALLARLGRAAAAARVLGRLEGRRYVTAKGGLSLRRAELLLQSFSGRAAARRFRFVRQRYPHYPDQARLLWGEASGLLLAGQHRAAAPVLRRLLLRHPAATETRAAQTAVDRLRAAGTKVSPFTPSERAWRAVRLGRTGRVSTALSALGGLERLPGADRALLALHRARVLLSNYRYAAAVAPLDRARKQGRGAVKWEAERRLGVALRRGGRYARLARRYGRPGPRGRLRGATPARQWHAAKVALLRGRRGEAARLLRWAGPDRRKGLLAGYLAFRNGQHGQAAQLLGPLTHRRGLARAARYWLGRTRIAQGRRQAGLALLGRVARSEPLDWYAVLARRRLGRLTGRRSASPRPVAPLPVRRETHFDRLAAALGAQRRAHPRLARAALLLRWGLAAEALAELRVVARDQVLAGGGRRGRFLRPISRWAAFRGVRHRAAPRELSEEGAGGAGGEALPRLLYRAFQRLGDPYMANRFVRRRAGRPRLRVQTPYGAVVRAQARRASLPAGWVWAIMTVESAYSAEVVSQAGALGLLQIMPLTGRRIARSLGVANFRLDQLFSPAVNLRFGVWYLGQLVRKFRGQLALAAAAYNGGPHNVELWLRTRAATAELDEFVEEIPMRETRLYVKKVVGLAARYAVKLGEPYADLVRLKLSPTTVDCIDF